MSSKRHNRANVLILFLLALGLSVSRPSPAEAQQANEQEVLAHIEMCWDAWMDAIREGDADDYFDKCPQVDTAGYWNATDGAPGGERTVRRQWERIRETDLDWIDMRPVLITIHEDVAIVHFYGYWLAPSPDGPQTTEWKRTEVFRKVGDGYILLGAHSSPTSNGDAEPYTRF